MTPVIYSKNNSKVSPKNNILIQFTPDRLELTDILYDLLQKDGYSLTHEKSDACYLFTGTYHGYFDVFHDKIKHGRFVISEIKTGNEMLIIDVGDSGLTSAESQLKLVVEEMKQFKE